MKQIFFFFCKRITKFLLHRKEWASECFLACLPFGALKRMFFFFSSQQLPPLEKKKLFQKLDMNPVLLLNPSVSCQMLASVSLFQQLAFVHLKGNTNADTENKKCSMAVAESVCDGRGRASSRFLYRHKCLLFVLCATLAAGSLIKCSLKV